MNHAIDDGGTCHRSGAERRFLDGSTGDFLARIGGDLRPPIDVHLRNDRGGGVRLAVCSHPERQPMLVLDIDERTVRQLVPVLTAYLEAVDESAGDVAA